MTFMSMLRVRGRIKALVSIAILGLAATSTPSFAQDSEYPLSGLGISQLVDFVVGQIDTTCLTCGPIVPAVNADDTVGKAVVLGLGYINPAVQIGSPNPGSMTSLLAYCQPFLAEFLANTEFVGPLITYGTCLESNSVPAVLATLPVSIGNVSFLAGVCVITLRAHESAYYRNTAFSGTTDCKLGSDAGGAYGLRPSVSGGAHFLDFVNGPNPANGGFDVAGSSFTNAYVTGTSSGARTGYLGVATLGKVKLGTSINPGSPVNCPSANATCGYTWVPLPNKNLDTSTTLCSTDNVSHVESCTVSSIPITHETIAVWTY